MCSNKNWLFYISVGVFIGGLILTGCTPQRMLTNPGTNPGVHNQKLLATTIHESAKKLAIPMNKLKGQRVCIKVFAGRENEATIYNAVSSHLINTGCKIYPEDKADYRLVVGTDYAGVNQQIDGVYMILGQPYYIGRFEFPYFTLKSQSYAKTNLYGKLLNLKTGEVEWMNTATASKTDNIYSAKSCFLGPYSLGLFDVFQGAEE